MATYKDGNVHRATPNTVTAARRSAENRRCPKCGRKSALVHLSEPTQFGRACRWDDCDYASMTQRDGT